MYVERDQEHTPPPGVAGQDQTRCRASPQENLCAACLTVGKSTVLLASPQEKASKHSADKVASRSDVMKHCSDSRRLDVIWGTTPANSLP